MRSKLLMAAAVLLAAWGGTAKADVIFDNGDTVSLGGLPGMDLFFLAADNFNLQDGQSTIANIHWTGFYAPDNSGDAKEPVDAFTVYIFADNGGEPGTLLEAYANEVERTPAGSSSFGVFPEYDYVMNIDPLALMAGTTYWIAILNDVTLPLPDKGDIQLPDAWFWSFSDVQSGDAHQKLIAAWLDANVELAFQLTNDGVVPEPATLTLLGAGLVGIAARRRLSKRR